MCVSIYACACQSCVADTNPSCTHLRRVIHVHIELPQARRPRGQHCAQCVADGVGGEKGVPEGEAAEGRKQGEGLLGRMLVEQEGVGQPEVSGGGLCV